MKMPQYNLLSLAIYSALASQAAWADLRSQCLAGVPHFQGELVEGDHTTLPIYIEANQAEINQPQNATYRGNVVINQGNRTLLGEEVYFEQNANKTRYIQIKGPFDYRDHLIQASGQNVNMNLNAEQAELANLNYQFVGRQGRGKAEQVAINTNQRVMHNATFTSCLSTDNAWAIDADKMIQHVEQEYAELWHARFKIFDVPVLYSPYLQFPIGERRRSGLLLPQNVGHSKRDGYSYSQPIYWNIAPNMDATLTPTYYSKRGWQISPEFRYLTQIGEGKIAAEYLRNDRLSRNLGQPPSRHLLFLQHHANFLTNWRLSLDYTRVSDSRYFSEFDSLYGHSTDGYATQNFKISYHQPSYNLSISGKKFQTFDQSGSTPYYVLPQIEWKYYKNNLNRYGDFALRGQLSQFANDNANMPRAWRLHLEPTLKMPLANRYGNIELETKLYATQYWQKSGKGSQAEAVEKHITRVLPQLKLELASTLVAGKPLIQGFEQTLEPRIQYLFRPYKNQSKIGSKRQSNLGLGYDSALLQQDYYSLFNDRRYSGLDRIASANQITLGGTTRFFNQKTGSEVFNLSAGQIIYLSPSRIDSLSQNSTTGRASSWVVESNWKFHPKWNWHSSYQYDTRLNETALANFSLRYKPQDENLIQFNYRYASKNYIDQNLSDNRYGQDIKQIGLTTGWKLTDNISMMMSHYQDIALKKPVESQLGFTYNSCCWNATLYTARRLMATPNGKADTIRDLYYDNRFGVNFELRLGTSYHSGVSKLLKRGMIPYTDSFNIN